jgi:hypothetical protein
MPSGSFQVLFAALLICSCQDPVAPTELNSTDSLIRLLARDGAKVTRAETMPTSAYPFFSTSAQRIVVNGADVQVFEYPNAARADSDAARVSPNGTPIGQAQISWMDTPSFYKRDRVIVLYVGHAVDISQRLESILGPPFARGQ